jgi:hypothetical protein
MVSFRHLRGAMGPHFVRQGKMELGTGPDVSKLLAASSSRRQFRRGINMGVLVNWNRCKQNVWCTFLELELEDEHFDDLNGVYVIWRGEEKREVLRVGIGDIRDSLTKEKNAKYSSFYGHSRLYVTWAKVESDFCDGVARYLVETLNPKSAGKYPASTPIEINLPWSDLSFPWED